MFLKIKLDDSAVGAIYLLKTIADRLGLSQALGSGEQAKLALWQIMSRIFNQGSRLSAIRLAEQHAVCDLLKISHLNKYLICKYSWGHK